MALTGLTNLQPLHIKTVGIGTFDNAVSIGGTLTYEDVTNVDAIGIITARSGINVSGGQLDVGSNIKLGNAGVVTATSFVGNGSGLTGITQTTINNNAANKVIMGSNTANTLEAVAKSTLFGNLSHGQNFLDDQNLVFGDASDMILIHQASGAKSRIRNTNDSGSLDIESTLTRFTNKDGSTEKLRLDNSGNILTSGNTQLIGSNTSDGSDNKAIMINGGGAVSDTRGGYMLVHGNEHSSNPGITRLHAGNVGTAYIAFNTGGNERLRITSDGVLTFPTAGIGLHNSATNSYFFSHGSNETRLYHSGNAQIKLSFYGNGNVLRGAISADANGMHILTAGSGEQVGVKCITNDSVELYHNGNRQVFTIDGGMNWQDNKKAEFGASGDLKIYHNGTDSRIDNGTNKLRIGNTHNNEIKFFTQNSTRWNVGGTGHIYPDLNNTYDIGTTTYRVRNIYTNDLNLSNKGSTNSVDNTWGDYTIQEGESDLFLINNRSGKKYKFNLTEVS